MQSELIFYVIGGLIFQCLLLYLIISSATKAEKRARYDWAQTHFLAYLAKKNGMSDDEADDILKHL